ncbi:hypothetical protein PtB15_5B543 [Puccinia triticina]|nr:hypothetical protein PtB15_5B543 [Puccinia triticina]
MSPEHSEEIHRYRRTVLLLLYLHTDRGLERPLLDRFASLKEQSFVGKDVLQRQVNEIRDQFEKIDVQDPTREIDHRDEQGEPFLLDQSAVYKDPLKRVPDFGSARLPATYPADIPCLYLGASADPAFPPELFTESSKAALFPGANLSSHVVRGGNHFMHQDPVCRDHVSAVLGKWIDSHASSAPKRPSRL